MHFEEVFWHVPCPVFLSKVLLLSWSTATETWWLMPLKQPRGLIRGNKRKERERWEKTVPTMDLLWESWVNIIYLLVTGSCFFKEFKSQQKGYRESCRSVNFYYGYKSLFFLRITAVSFRKGKQKRNLSFCFPWLRGKKPMNSNPKWS